MRAGSMMLVHAVSSSSFLPSRLSPSCRLRTKNNRYSSPPLFPSRNWLVQGGRFMTLANLLVNLTPVVCEVAPSVTFSFLHFSLLKFLYVFFFFWFSEVRVIYCCVVATGEVAVQAQEKLKQRRTSGTGNLWMGTVSLLMTSENFKLEKILPLLQTLTFRAELKGTELGRPPPK